MSFQFPSGGHNRPCTVIAFDRDELPRRSIFAAEEHGDEANRQALHAKLTPRPYLCWTCEHELTYANGLQRRPHFRHLSKVDCPSVDRSETEEHHALKRRVVEIVSRHQGWTASPEVAGKGWRADVLAEQSIGRPLPGRSDAVFHPDVVFAHSNSRRIAFEVQTSAQTAGTTQRRTAKYVDAEVEVVWLLSWSGVKPELHENAVGVEKLDDDYFVTTGRIQMVTNADGKGSIVDQVPITLEQFIAKVLQRREQAGVWPGKGRNRSHGWYPTAQHERIAKKLHMAETWSARWDTADQVVRVLQRSGHSAPRLTKTGRERGCALVASIPGVERPWAIHPDPDLIDACSALKPYQLVTATSEDAARFVRAGFDAVSVSEVTVPAVTPRRVPTTSVQAQSDTTSATTPHRDRAPGHQITRMMSEVAAADVTGDVENPERTASTLPPEGERRRNLLSRAWNKVLSR